MPYEKRPCTGTLFYNNKGDNERRPDMKGTLVLSNGLEVEISAWKKTSRNGKEFLSLKLGNYTQPRQSAHEQDKANGHQPQSSLDGLKDDIPF